MKQDAFVERHRAEWDAFEHWLDTRGESARRARTRHDANTIADSEIPARYRRLTQQLALASRRGYSAQVTARLQALMQRGHAVLYRTPAPRWHRVAAFFIGGF